MSKTAEQINNDWDDYDSSDFSDEEETSHEVDLGVAIELILEWIYEQTRKLNRKLTKKKVLENIAAYCVILSYVKLPDVMRILTQHELVTVIPKDSSVRYDKDRLKSFSLAEVKADALRRAKCQKSPTEVGAGTFTQITKLEPIKSENRKTEDLFVVLEKVVTWLKNATKLPSSYYELAHAITKFCEVRHLLNEEEVFYKMHKEGKIVLVDNEESGGESDEAFVELSNKSLLIFQPAEKDKWKRRMAYVSMLFSTFFFMYLIPVIGSYLLGHVDNGLL